MSGKKPIRLAFIAFMAFIACKEARAIAVQFCAARMTTQKTQLLLTLASYSALQLARPNGQRTDLLLRSATTTFHNTAPRLCRRSGRQYEEAFIAFIAFIASRTCKVERWQGFEAPAVFPSRVPIFSHLGQVQSSLKLN